MSTQDPCKKEREEFEEVMKKYAEAQNPVNAITGNALNWDEMLESEKEKLAAARKKMAEVEIEVREKQAALDACEKKYSIK